MVSYFVVHLCEMLDEHDIDGCPKFRCSVTKFENPVVALAGKGFNPSTEKTTGIKYRRLTITAMKQVFIKSTSPA